MAMAGDARDREIERLRLEIAALKAHIGRLRTGRQILLDLLALAEASRQNPARRRRDR